MITPTDSPSSPENFAAVTPHGPGAAPYDIQADNGQADIAAAFNAANAISGQGVLYPAGPRQAQTEALMQSPPGFGSAGYDIDAGSAADWPTNVEPGG